MEYQPKSVGITYLRHAIIAQKKRPNSKFVTIPMKQAEEIINQSADFKSVNGKFIVTQNSVRAASLTLCVPVQELCEKLNSPSISKLLSDLAEAKNKIHALERTGDRLAQIAGDKDFGAIKDWVHAKKL
jgi:hypothetical protein